MAMARSRARNAESAEAILDGARQLSRLASTTSAICAEAGLTLQQYRMLLKLVEEPMRASALARRSGITRATLSTVIRNLEQRGLVTRTAVEEDARGVSIDVTADGRAAVQAVDDRLAALVVALSSHTGLRSLLDFLETLREPVDRQATAYKERNLERSVSTS